MIYFYLCIYMQQLAIIDINDISQVPIFDGMEY